MITFGNNQITHEWTELTIDPRTPILLASIQTIAEMDTAQVRIRSYATLEADEPLYVPLFPGQTLPEAIGDRRFSVPLGRSVPVAAEPIRLFRPMLRVEEERSGDDEIEHAPEFVGHIAFEPGWIEDATGDEIGYARTLATDEMDRDTWIPLPIDPDDFSVEESVAFAQVLSVNEDDPVHVRLATSHPQTGSPGFYFRMEEWPSYDGRHAPEALGIVVLRKGVHPLDSEGPLWNGFCIGIDSTD